MNLASVTRFFVVLLLCFASSGQAVEEAAISPDKLVQKVTETLLTDIAIYRDAMDAAEKEAEKEALLSDFYQSLTTALEPVIDFKWISLNVMGQYRKQASSLQREKFKEVFTRSLVETYGRGLLTYSDEKIVVYPLEDSESGKRKVVVNQEIKGVGESYPLQYSMGLNSKGEWKVINVIINGINLGKTFRNQFVQAVATYDGDIDQVIANWAASEVANQ